MFPTVKATADFKKRIKAQRIRVAKEEKAKKKSEKKAAKEKKIKKIEIKKPKESQEITENHNTCEKKYLQICMKLEQKMVEYYELMARLALLEKQVASERYNGYAKEYNQKHA